jgi:hypothetical protein
MGSRHILIKNQRKKHRVIGRPFQIGNPGGPGGDHGGGRPPNEFKEWMRGLIRNPKAQARLHKILEDREDADEKVTEQGVCVPTRCKANVYLQALDLIMGFTESRPAEKLEVTNTMPDAVAKAVNDAKESLKEKEAGGGT